MVVTALWRDRNLWEYLELETSEDVYVIRDGRTVVRAVSPRMSAVDALRSLLTGTREPLERRPAREESGAVRWGRL